MALITELRPMHHDRHVVHGLVECGYKSFETDGRRYLQLDTYGSPDRVMPGKVSQSLQLDEAAARQLVAVISQAFPGISRPL